MSRFIFDVFNKCNVLIKKMKHEYVNRLMNTVNINGTESVARNLYKKVHGITSHHT